MNPKHMLLSAAVLASTLTVTAAAHASVVWNGNLEPGNLSQYQLGDSLADKQYCTVDDAVVYSTATATRPPPAQGTYALQLKADNTDVYPCTPTGNPRAQVGSAPIMPDTGGVYFESWKMRVPTTFPDVPNKIPGTTTNAWLVTQQDHAAPFAGSPILGFGIHDKGDGVDRIDLRNENGVIVWETPLAGKKGTWLTFTTEKKVTSTSAGYVRFWFNGVQQSFVNCTAALGSCVDPTRFDRATMRTGSTEAHRFYLANYRALNAIPGAVTLFFDAAKVATTKAEAEAA